MELRRGSFNYSKLSGAGSQPGLTERVLVRSEPGFPIVSRLGDYLDGMRIAWASGPTPKDWSGSIELDCAGYERLEPLLRDLRTAGRIPAATQLDGASRLSWYSEPPKADSGGAWVHTAVGDLIHRAKYKQDQGAARDLAGRVAEFAAFHPKYRKATGVVWAHSSTELAETIGRAVAKRLGIDAAGASLVDGKARPKAKNLTGDDDDLRVAPSDLLIGQISNPESVLMVDDVWTTGKTLGALAEACRLQLGAGRIYVIVSAQTHKGSKP